MLGVDIPLHRHSLCDGEVIGNVIESVHFHIHDLWLNGWYFCRWLCSEFWRYDLLGGFSVDGRRCRVDGRAGKNEPVLNIGETEQDHCRARELQEVALEIASRDTRKWRD